ncbi:MAG: DinB family protein [Candidatus Dadabacteria bacterium]
MTREQLIEEFKTEAASTRRMLERVPEDKYSWKPHDKSTTIGRLATHVAELPRLIAIVLTTDELNFAASKFVPVTASSKDDLIRIFEDNYGKAVNALQNSKEEDYNSRWSLKSGDHTIFTLSKLASIRRMGINHILHHRGQLSVYLRLLDVPVPGMYGPTADEPF